MYGCLQAVSRFAAQASPIVRPTCLLLHSVSLFGCGVKQHLASLTLDLVHFPAFRIEGPLHESHEALQSVGRDNDRSPILSGV